MVKRKKRSIHIIVPTYYTRTQIRRKFKKAYPKKVITRMIQFPSYRGRKGVGIDYRKRK